MLAEAAVGVLAMIYKKKINDHLHDDMMREVQKEYGSENKTTDAYDFLQHQVNYFVNAFFYDFIVLFYFYTIVEMLWSQQLQGLQEQYSF